MDKMKNPVGIENFEMIRASGFYYVDKTEFIPELVHDAFPVNLITRPRRFGKTLMMNMLKCFFDIRRDSRQLFEGLAVSRYEDICAEWRNQWPVLFLPLKDISRMDFEKSYSQLAFNISSLCIEHQYLLESEKVNGIDKDIFARLMDRTASSCGNAGCHQRTFEHRIEDQ